MGAIVKRQNSDLFVRNEEITTVTALDGSKWTAQKFEVIEKGKKIQFKHGLDMYSSPTHPQGQQLMFSRHNEYDAKKTEKRQTETSTEENKQCSKREKQERKENEECPIF